MMQWLRLSPGIDSIPCEDSVLLKSDFVSLRLEGASATMVAERIIPFLTEWRKVDDLCQHISDYDPADIRSLAGQLVASGVLTSSDSGPLDIIEDSPWHAMLHVLGVPVAEAVNRLKSLRIAIFGLETIGGSLALQLGQMGVGSFTLVDPGQLTLADRILMPPSVGIDADATRQRAIAGQLKSMQPKMRVNEFEGDTLTKEDVKDIVRNVDFAIGTFDRGFSASNQWINSACLEVGTPSLYCDLQGVHAYVGPVVFPGETACYMCWRMRYIAARDNFTEAMAYESAMDKAKTPKANTRPAFPPLVSWAASLASLEILRITLGLAAPQTANHVLELNALEMSMQDHAFLHRPDCPSCQGKLQAVIRGQPHAANP